MDRRDIDRKAWTHNSPPAIPHRIGLHPKSAPRLAPGAAPAALDTDAQLSRM